MASQTISRAVWGTVQIDHDTEEYNRAHAQLPWYYRHLARNWLTIFYSVPPSVLSILLFLGIDKAVNAVSVATTGDPGARLGMWFVVSTILLEVGVDIVRTDLNPAYIQTKPVYWIILAVVWSASLVASGGNLGMWAFGVYWLGWWLGVFVDVWFWSGQPVQNALWDAALIATFFLIGVSSLSGYIYVLSTVGGVAQLALTGCVYPTIAYCVQEVSASWHSVDADKGAGLSENDDVERGTFISVVVCNAAYVQLVNKVAIAQITSTYDFIGTMALSFAIEVLGKATVMWWHRNKAVVKDTVRQSTKSIIPSSDDAEPADPSGMPMRAPARAPARPPCFAKASHRHANGNDKKRYEFRIYYEELGESIATMVAFGALIGTEKLQPADGLSRLAFTLVCEYIADLVVWVMVELDGYNLANVVYRFSSARIGALVFAAISALVSVELGNEMVAMAVVNVLVNGTVGNSTSNGTMNVTEHQ